MNILEARSLFARSKIHVHAMQITCKILNYALS